MFLASITLGQETPLTPQTAAQAGVTIEQVIVTGSNIPTSEEVGPNPVDTYRPEDLEKLGVRNATDLLVKLPPEAGSTINQNIANGGDGSVVPNLRGLLPKETLVLIDGKRVAITGLAGGVDINLIPFPLIDHIDILKDGASAIYGSDAVAGVFNIFLVHKFRGLEIGGSIGNTNLGASNDARELEGWLSHNLTSRNRTLLRAQPTIRDIPATFLIRMGTSRFSISRLCRRQFRGLIVKSTMLL